MQAARQDTERNADAPVVAHRRTIATLRTGTCTITAADPMPDLPDALGDQVQAAPGDQAEDVGSDADRVGGLGMCERGGYQAVSVG